MSSEHGRRDGANGEVDRVARLLITEWERVEGERVNISRIATFADMARVAVADNRKQLAAAEADRDSLRAEIDRVSAERNELHRELKAVVDYAIDEVGMPVTSMLGADAPTRVMRKLHLERNEAVRYHESNEVEYGRIVDSLRAELAKLRPVYEAAKRFPTAYSGSLVKPHSDWPNINNGWQCPVHALLTALAAIDAATKERGK